MSESWQVCPDTWLWEVVGIARPKLQTTLFNFLSNRNQHQHIRYPFWKCNLLQAKDFCSLNLKYFCKLSNLVKGKLSNLVKGKTTMI